MLTKAFQVKHIPTGKELRVIVCIFRLSTKVRFMRIAEKPMKAAVCIFFGSSGLKTGAGNDIHTIFKVTQSGTKNNLKIDFFKPRLELSFHKNSHDFFFFQSSICRLGYFLKRPGDEHKNAKYNLLALIRSLSPDESLNNNFIKV